MNIELKSIESANPLSNKDFLDAVLYQLLDKATQDFRILATDILIKFRRQIIENDEFMNISKASKRTGISRVTIHSWIKTGKLNVYNNNNSIYVSVSELQYLYKKCKPYRQKKETIERISSL